VTARDGTPAPDLTALQPRHFYRYPSRLVDAIVDYDPGRRLVALKQVTVNEEFFQGHFPGLPLMPAVLQIEALSQAAAALVLEHTGLPTARVALRGITGGKFRRAVVPGDHLRLELTLQRARARLALVQAAAFVGDDVVAEATLLLAIDPGPASVHPTAIVHTGARIGRGSIIGPHCVIGPDVTIGERCRLGRLGGGGRHHHHRRRDRDLPDGVDRPGPAGPQVPRRADAAHDRAPQHLPRVRHHQPRHRGRRRRNAIGDGNLFMAYVHVAHDCRVGSDTIFGPHATLGGHVTVENFANISAGSAVHQFCRVGPYAFIGGYSVVTKDALPYARTIGSRPARVFRRQQHRALPPRLHARHREPAQTRLSLPAAVEAEHEPRAERDRKGPRPRAPEVRSLVEFIRTSKRGVILRRPTRRAEELVAEE
jgi:UDP-N-acetylglucosamine acyltransferase